MLGNDVHREIWPKQKSPWNILRRKICYLLWQKFVTITILNPVILRLCNGPWLLTFMKKNKNENA